MEFSKTYYELYNDIANYRVLTEEQINKLESLTPLERLKLIIVYNDLMKLLKDANIIYIIKCLLSDH